MSASTTCATARVAARVAAVVLIGIGVAAAAVTPSEALGLPDPTTSSAGPLTPVGDLADQLTRPLTGAAAPAPALPAPLPAGDSPASSGTGGSSGTTAPGPSSGQPARSAQSSPSGRARVGGEDAVAVDAEVEGLLGLCVRVPGDGSNPRADVVVLDRDLLAVLSMAGVPVRDAIAPCPVGVAAPTGTTPGATGGSSTTQAASAPGGAGPTDRRLAFTGADVVPTTLVASGLLWLGVVLTLTARRLRVVPQLG